MSFVGLGIQITSFGTVHDRRSAKKPLERKFEVHLAFIDFASAQFTADSDHCLPRTSTPASPISCSRAGSRLENSEDVSNSLLLLCANFLVSPISKVSENLETKLPEWYHSLLCDMINPSPALRPTAEHAQVRRLQSQTQNDQYRLERSSECGVTLGQHAILSLPIPRKLINWTSLFKYWFR